MLEIKIGKNGAMLSEEEGAESTPLLLVRFTAAKEKEQKEQEEAESTPSLEGDDLVVGTPVLTASPVLDSGAVINGLVRVAGRILVEKRKALNAAEQANQTMKSMQQFFSKMMQGGNPGNLPPWLKGD